MKSDVYQSGAVVPHSFERMEEPQVRAPLAARMTRPVPS
jgi:hypothetical protein